MFRIQTPSGKYIFVLEHIHKLHLRYMIFEVIRNSKTKGTTQVKQQRQHLIDTLITVCAFLLQTLL